MTTPIRYISSPGRLPYILITAILFSLVCTAQEEQLSDSVQRTATFTPGLSGNAVEFLPHPPALIQMAGAPKAYYSYFWEFGDGHYSREERPRHVYGKQGAYEVTLWATNHYDNGKTPATRPQKIEVREITESHNDQALLGEDLLLQRNREPVPEEDIVVILSYRNPKPYVTGGKLYLFYNEQQYRDRNFELTDTRTYNGEKPVPEAGFAYTGTVSDGETLLASATGNPLPKQQLQDSTERVNLPLTLEESKSYYKDWSILEFDRMAPGEERNVFFTLRTTPEMLKDTSAIVTVRSIYVPDENYDNHKVKDMEMEIVTSHDPNRMSSNATVMNYRLVRFKTFRYKIRFQNNGEGPASTIRLETDIPEMFDKSTIEIEDLYPECPICPDEKEVSYSCIDTTYKENKAVFTFKNIYLPGSEQKNVKEYDSTKGFVKYRIKPAPDFHKKKTKSRTAIYFDKNEPVITNYATTRFLPGISIGAKAGYMWSPGLDNHKEYFAGVTISPYKSYRGYLQAELMFSANSFDKLKTFTEEAVRDNNFIDTYRVKALEEYRNISLYMVPVSYRYTINNYLAVGSGIQLRTDLSSTQCTTTTGEYSLVIPSEDIDFRDDTRDRITQTDVTRAFDHFQTGIFAGFNAGFARIGPSIGARYIYNLNSPHSQIQLYAIWKF
ncbi:PKD domain-containing protein [Sinomicrobium soli]|uniref:PKD domain-containing protein n=1 Tax=Sinomicrobium sp. N-1-3-6 TaxID=2219864 RepID=UPI000DCEF482|nr:PKD domain-containing protein [Sinomicrobium sp. N-1-3-6]RAV30544.1 PKD domain-containing protein [Sinomicrobium sp. N-1-3-6]